MRLEELVKVTSSEEKAEEFLREKGILKTFTRCPKCGSKRLGRVRRNFYKCYNCKREFSVRRREDHVIHVERRWRHLRRDTHRLR